MEPIMRTRILIAALLVTASTAQAQQYDIVLSNATIIDGTGAARYTGSVGIANGRITRVARDQIPAAQGRRVIDVKGQILAPGFIDMHAHLEPLLEIPSAQ